MYPGKPSAGIRFAAIVLDYIFVTIPFTLLIVTLRPDLIPKPELIMQPKDEATRLLYMGMILLFMLKDSFGARSLAKHMLGLHIIDHKSGYRARGVQCFVRNIPIMVWFVEIVVVLFSPDRRLGDLMGGTRVVTNEYLRDLQQRESLLDDPDES